VLFMPNRRASAFIRSTKAGVLPAACSASAICRIVAGRDQKPAQQLVDGDGPARLDIHPCAGTARRRNRVGRHGHVGIEARATLAECGEDHIRRHQLRQRRRLQPLRCGVGSQRHSAAEIDQDPGAGRQRRRALRERDAKHEQAGDSRRRRGDQRDAESARSETG
jgi:hypothetical protein